MEMESNGSDVSAAPELCRWAHLLKVLTRRGPYNHASFEPSVEYLTALRNARVLVVGAGKAL